jgi:OOP family OmpA-OmpF porin
MRITIAGILFFAMVASAAAKDVEGSADHPLVPRYEGSEITRYETESFTDYELRVDKAAAKPDATLTLEGKLSRITYQGPAERAVLEVFKNYEAALSGASFSTLFSCVKQDCGDIPKHVEKGPIYMALWGEGDHRCLATRLSRAEGDVYVSLYITKNGSGGPARGRAMVQLDVIELKPMEDKMVVAEASAMERDLASAGRVAVYGILFDFDKDTMRPDSKPQLDEIGKLLADSPELKVLIVGHTDSDGSHEYNLDLSQRRAASVAAALARDYGVDRMRLTPIGVGMAAPVATNRTEAGQMLNRRVELVER